jgi:transcriptional regulator with XRE-family HTH domain
MTSEHVRAARMLLRWDQKELAKKSGISLPTIKRLESQPGTLGAYPDTIATIRKAFEDQGIEFFDGDAPGARLHKARGGPGTPRKLAAASAEPAHASKPVAGAKTVRPKKTRQRRS